jgi:hypothetical protein
VKLAMVDPADRDDELVAHSASECARLCEGEVMRIRGHAAAHEACLSQHESAVVFVAQSNRFAQRTDYFAVGLVLGPRRCLLPAKRIQFAGCQCLVRDSTRRLMGTSLRGTDRRKPCPEALFDYFGVGARQRVLGSEIPLRPGSRPVRGIYSRHLLNQAFAKACR